MPPISTPGSPSKPRVTVHENHLTRDLVDVAALEDFTFPVGHLLAMFAHGFKVSWSIAVDTASNPLGQQHSFALQPRFAVLKGQGSKLTKEIQQGKDGIYTKPASTDCCT